MRVIGPSTIPAKYHHLPRISPCDDAIAYDKKTKNAPNENRYLHAYSLSTDGRPNLKWLVLMPEKHQIQLYFSTLKTR